MTGCCSSVQFMPMLVGISRDQAERAGCRYSLMVTTTDMATDSAIKALTEAGRTITDHRPISFGEQHLLGGALKSVFGGKLSMSRVDVIVAEGPSGQVVVLQPYDGNTPLPGELHAVVRGALRASAAYGSSNWGGFNWHSDDEEIQGYLRSQKFSAQDLPEDLKHGLGSIRLDWTVQAFPVAADRSWIACQLGGFSGSGSHGAALTVVDQLAPAIAMSAASGPMASPHPLRLNRLAELAFEGQLTTALEEGVAPPKEVHQLDPQTVETALRSVLQRHVGKRVLLSPITDAKKLGNIASKVAVGLDGADILAFVDTGLRASGKAGVAFTSDAIHINELGDRYVFKYEAIATFRLDGAEVSISGVDGTSMSIASNGEAAIIMEGLTAATGRPG